MDFRMLMNLWDIQIPAPMALAVVAAVGYLISRRNRKTCDIVLRSRRELQRAQAVAAELEKVAGRISQSLARHHDSLSHFKARLGRLNDQEQAAAWRDLCRECEKILKPTMQLATQISGAYDEIRQQSAALMSFTQLRTDPLTGLNNRRALDDTLNTQFALLKRYNDIFALVMFDVDHFKVVNDQHGHVHGDHVLQELSRLFDESLRDTDFIARYGGEEFVIIMPHTDLDSACLLAERLRAEVENRLGVTVSGGVTTARDDDNQDTLIARADAALYSAKSAGRNRIFSHNAIATEAAAAGQSSADLLEAEAE
jgi:diguanylate cyclase